MKSNGTISFLEMDDTEYIVFLTVSFVFGAIITVLGSIQLWCLHFSIFKRCMDSLLVSFLHLSMADMLQGILLLIPAVLAIIQREISTPIEFISDLVEIILIYGGRYLCTVSILTLNTLTVLKMIRVLLNTTYPRCRIRWICRAIWLLTFLFVGADYIAYKATGYKNDRRLWLPVLTGLTFVNFVCCFGRIYFALRRTERRVIAQPSRTGGRFLRIAIFQLSTFLICAVPWSIFRIVTFFVHVEKKKSLLFTKALRFLLILNPISDAIIFFVVYRHKLRRVRQQDVRVKYDRRSAYVLPRPPLQREGNE